MSTMVQMPVRVKPPPADIGEIISPGCASFEMTTPSNGARTTVVEIGLAARSTSALGDRDLLLRQAIRACSDSTSASGGSSSAWP